MRSAVSFEDWFGTHVPISRKGEIPDKWPMKPGDRGCMVSRKDIAGESSTVISEEDDRERGRQVEHS